MIKDFEIKTTFSAVDRVSQVVSKIRSRIVQFTARASMALRKLDRVTSRLATGLGSLMKRGALLAAGAATGLFVAINKTANSMDLLAKQTREVNFPIEEFQEWRFVAEQSGIDGDKFSKGMLTFNKRLGKLKGGFGPLASALKKTNPELAKQLIATTDSAQAMDIYVKAIQEAKGADMKSMLADAAFGLTKMSLVGMNSAETIAELRAQMRENGLVTEDQAAKAEAYNDMMNRLKLTVTGFVVEALTPLMPMLTEAANAVREWMVANKGMVRSKIAEYIKKIPYWIEMIVKWAPRIAKFVGIFYGIAAAVKVLRGAMWLLNKATVSTAISMAEVGTNGTSAIDKTTVATKKATGAAGKLQGALALVGAAVAGWEIGTIIYEDLVAPLIEAQDKLDKLTADVSDTMGRDKSKRGTAQLNKDMAKINELEKNMDTGFSGIAKNWLPDITGAFGMFENMAKQSIKKEKGDIRSELEQRAIGAEFSTTGTGPMSIMEPTSTQSKTEQVVKHQVEMTINDAGGKTKIKSGKTGPGFTLKHTGVAI